MPKEVREVLESGFSQLATLPKKSLKSVASQVTRWLDPSEPEPEIDVLARGFGVAVPTMSRIVAAVTFQASALFAGPKPMPLSTFVSKATSAGVLKEGYATAIEKFVKIYLIPRRSALVEALARANASSRQVPSFQNLVTTIDLRVVRVTDQRVVTTPIVIATMRTDVQDQELLFQMTPRDVGGLVQQLTDVTKRLARCKGMTTQLASRK
jgi:hypothetical protein